MSAEDDRAAMLSSLLLCLGEVAERVAGAFYAGAYSDSLRAGLPRWERAVLRFAEWTGAFEEFGLSGKRLHEFWLTASPTPDSGDSASGGYYWSEAARELRRILKTLEAGKKGPCC